MRGLIGKKIGMTRVFNDLGFTVPVTILELGPCNVIQVKTKKVTDMIQFKLVFPILQ